MAYRYPNEPVAGTKESRMSTVGRRGAPSLSTCALVGATLLAIVSTVAACSGSEDPAESQSDAATAPSDASDDGSDIGTPWDSGVDGATCFSQTGGCSRGGVWVNCTALSQPYVPAGCAAVGSLDQVGWVSFCCEIGD
jgi:hypothetical protein